MAQRSVFKIFGSLGPGGTFVTLTEKIIRRFFNEAYDLGDTDVFQASEEAEIVKLRHEYVNELFNMQSDFERKSNSLNALIQVRAYADLHKLLEKYKKKIIILEKQKYYKEKMFYLGEENQLKADAAGQKLDNVEKDVADNLNKMAIHILKPNLMKLQEANTGEQPSIDQRVTQVKAEEYLAYWKQLKVKNGLSDDQESTNNEQTKRLKDQLFIRFGEDVKDIFEAFQYYGLDTKVTEEDKNQYSIQ